MSERAFQYRLRDLHVAVACVALVLGAAVGGLARVLLVSASAIFVVLMAGALLCLAVVFLFEGAGEAWRWTCWSGRLPFWIRQAWFERRLARVRPGQTSQRVKRMLGTPWRVDGFGDRLYWSYRVSGQRYTVSFDPRRLVAKYSNGLARDLPTCRA
jgi:hypothetical protein